MPYPFVLPTTSAFSFVDVLVSDSHPSLSLSTSTQRGVARDALKRHGRLDPGAQTSHLASVVAALEGYIPYLMTVNAGLVSAAGGGGGGQESQKQQQQSSVRVTLTQPLRISWRPTLSASEVFRPGRRRGKQRGDQRQWRRPRRKVEVGELRHEVFFVLATLAFARGATARSCLRPLYSTTSEVLGATERTVAITTATRHLLDMAAIFDYLAAQQQQQQQSQLSQQSQQQSQQLLPCIDVSPSVARALAELALAEATLLAVLKDDPYPAAVARARSRRDDEWMYKAPEMPRVRAHLFARLALAAAEHASRAVALCRGCGAGGGGVVSSRLVRYMEDLRRTSRAKACRFFGVDAEAAGDTADGIGWVRAGLHELGVVTAAATAAAADGAGKSAAGGLSRWKREFRERREDRRVDGGGGGGGGDGGGEWGGDAGTLEETRVLEELDAKWSRINDAINTKPIPPPTALLPKMPTGRDIHTIKPYTPPVLDRATLDTMRKMPTAAAAEPRTQSTEGHEDDSSSDDDDDDDDPMEEVEAPPGAFPGSGDDGRGGATGRSYY